MNKDQVKGRMEEAKGSVKTVGDAKEKVKDAIDKL